MNLGILKAVEPNNFSVLYIVLLFLLTLEYNFLVSLSFQTVVIFCFVFLFWFIYGAVQTTDSTCLGSMRIELEMFRLSGYFIFKFP